MGHGEPAEKTTQMLKGVDTDTRADIADAVEKLPWFGPIIAFTVRRGWWGAALLIVLLLVIIPVLAPLLAAVYIRVLPANLHRAYADVVTSAFAIDDSIEEQIENVVKLNNANLDFVQQYQTEWTDPYQTRFTTYTFPLKPRQDFDVKFEADTRAVDKPCSNASTEASEAEEALSSDQLFHIYINGGLQYSAGLSDAGSNIQYRKTFWDEQEKKTSLPESAESATGSVQVRLNTSRDSTGHSLAERALRCYRLSSAVRIIVYKTLLWNHAIPDPKSKQREPGGAPR